MTTLEPVHDIWGHLSTQAARLAATDPEFRSDLDPLQLATPWNHLVIWAKTRDDVWVNLEDYVTSCPDDVIREMAGDPIDGRSWIMSRILDAGPWQDGPLVLRARLRDAPYQDDGERPHQPPAERDTWAPLPDVLVAAATPPEPPSILTAQGGGALFYPGKRHVIAGEPETLKTWIAAAAAAEVITSGRGVIWWDADGMGPGPLVERLQALGTADESIDLHLHYIAPDRPIDPPARSLLRGLIATDRVGLAVIDAFDPALELHGMSHKDGDEVQRFYRTVVDVFHAEGVATVLVDHVTKDRENRGRWSIGSQRKLAGCDVAFSVELHGEPLSRRNPKATIIISGGKDRPGWHHRTDGRRVGQWTVDLENPGEPWTLALGRPESEVAADGGFRPTFLMERVSRHLELAPRGLTGRQVTDEVQGKASSIRDALRVLVTEGYAHVVQAERGAQVYRHIQLFTEATDPRQKLAETCGDAVGDAVGRTHGDAPTASQRVPHRVPAKHLQNPTASHRVPTASPTAGQTDDSGRSGAPPPKGGAPVPGRDPAGTHSKNDPTDPVDDWRRLLPSDHPEAIP